MSQINQLTAQDTLSAGDQIPIYSNGNGDTRRVSASALAAFMQSQLDTNGSFATQYAAPNATAFNVQVAPPVAGSPVFLLLTPTGAFAAGTITLPAQANMQDGQEVLVSCTQAVTALTVAGNGSTVNGAPTTLAANSFFRLRYDGVFKAFYRVG
jgi:hypothetical protein